MEPRTKDRRGWNVGVLFPHIHPLTLQMGGDTPRTRRLSWMKTVYTRKRCREVECPRTAHYLAPRPKHHWCNTHLPEEDRKRLSVEWQYRMIILPIASQLDRRN